MGSQLRVRPFHGGPHPNVAFGQGKTSTTTFDCSFLPRSSQFSCCLTNAIAITTIPNTYEEMKMASWKIGTSFDGAGDRWDFDSFIRDSNRQYFLLWPHYDSLSLDAMVNEGIPFERKQVSARAIEHQDISLKEVIQYAKRALDASREVVSLFTECRSCGDNIMSSRSGSSRELDVIQDHTDTVRSTKHRERESIFRKVSQKGRNLFYAEQSDISKTKKIRSGSKNPHRFFMWDLDPKLQLTYEEESEYISHVQDMLRLEDAVNNLRLQFNREPTMIEWASAVQLSVPTLRRQLDCGRRGREKLINANLGIVIRTAKQYPGRGLSHIDLLQAGIMGLEKSIEKFRPGASSRFSFCAFWWIRQYIRKTIFQHSRTIHLPFGKFNLLAKVSETKKSCFGEGDRNPSNDDLASSMGISVEQLNRLLFETRMPYSLERKICKEQDGTFKDMNADMNIEIPDICVARDLMRQHALRLVNFLEPNERLIMTLRFGIDDGNEKSFYEIGNLVGCSKEAARKLHNRGMDKLREFLTSHALHAYKDLLV